MPNSERTEKQCQLDHEPQTKVWSLQQLSPSMMRESKGKGLCPTKLVALHINSEQCKKLNKVQSNRPIFAKNEFDLRFLFLVWDLIWTTMQLTISTSDTTKFIENAFTPRNKEDGNAGRRSACWVCISRAAMPDLANPACVRPQLSSYRNTTEVCAKNWELTPCQTGLEGKTQGGFR